MKQLECPLNGLRNISEFHWGGPVKAMPDPVTASDAEWAAFLYLEDNIAGVVDEWWLHVPSHTWFVAKRNTITDEVISTMLPSAYFASQSGATP